MTVHVCSKLFDISTTVVVKALMCKPLASYACTTIQLWLSLCLGLDLDIIVASQLITATKENK